MIKEGGDMEFLLSQIAEGDNNAFRMFYDYYYPKIYKYASYFVKMKDAREEIVSDVFFNFWQNRKKISGIENLDGYLYIITRNKAFAYIKENTSSSDISAIEQVPQDKISHHETPEHIVVDEELSTAIKNAIDELPERCRLIFLMAREEGLKYKEIAGILSISEKTVNAQMVLAIKKLSKSLGKYFVFLFY